MFFHYLDRMNISLEEYAAYHSRGIPSVKEALQENFSMKILDKKTGDDYLQDLYSEYNTSNDIYYLYSLGRILRHKINNLPFDLSKEIQIIKQHLDKVESWGFFEFMMYTNTFFYSKTATSDKIIHPLSKNLTSSLTRLNFSTLNFAFSSTL